MFKLCGLFLLPLFAFAQLTPNSVIVTATRSATAKPDTARFSITISAAPTSTLEDVAAAGAPAGVTVANFISLSYYSTISALPVQWTFTTTAPLSELKSRIGVLTGLQTSFAKDKKFDLSFYVVGSEVSTQSQGCAMSDLVADARAQAAKLASGAGMSVGAVQAISGAVIGAAAASTGIGGASTVLTPSCSITVKFALTGGF